MATDAPQNQNNEKPAGLSAHIWQEGDCWRWSLSSPISGQPTKERAIAELDAAVDAVAEFRRLNR